MFRGTNQQSSNTCDEVRHCWNGDTSFGTEVGNYCDKCNGKRFQFLKREILS